MLNRILKKKKTRRFEYGHCILWSVFAYTNNILSTYGWPVTEYEKSEYMHLKQLFIYWVCYEKYARLLKKIVIQKNNNKFYKLNIYEIFSVKENKTVEN